MKRGIIIVGVIGAAVPVLWGILGFVLFTLPQSFWSDIFWWSVYVTCPPWLLPENSLSWLITPLANGLLYAGLAFAVLSTAKLMKKPSAK